MIEQISNSVSFFAFFTESKVGKTGLTVTVDVWEVTKTGTATEIVTAGVAVAVGDGLYVYVLSSGSVDAEGEYVCVFKTATTTVDQQHIPALWSIQRAGVENLDATVNSRSSHSAADVWAVATRALTDKAGFALSTAGILAIWDQLLSVTFGTGSLGEKIKLFFAALGTDNRPKQSADAHTGGATIAAVAGSVGSLAAQAKADVNAEVDTALADINLDHLVKNAVDTDFATTVHLDSVVGNLADNGTAASFSRATDSLEAIRDRGDAAWTTGSSASGSNAVTFTVRDSVSLANLIDVAVVVYGADGTTVVDTKRTNGSGQAVFSLDSASYYYAIPPVAGYSSVSNTALTVDGVEAVTVDVVALSSASTAPGTRLVRVIVRDSAGALKSGVAVSARLLANPSTVDQAVLDRQTLTATSDASGVADLTCITEGQFTGGDGIYRFNVPGAAHNFETTIPDGASMLYLEDLINA